MTKNVPKQASKLSKVVSFYLRSPEFARLKGNTQKDYEAFLHGALNTRVGPKLLGNYTVAQLQVRHVTEAYEKWLEVGVRTANYRKSCLNTAWRYAMRYDVMTHNPVSLVKTRSTEPRRVYWKPEQVKAFLDVAYSEYKWFTIGLIVHMAYDWAQRVGDMRLLTWDSLDLDSCRMELVQSKRSAGVELPISQGLCRILSNHKQEYGWQQYVAPKLNIERGLIRPYKKDEISPIINDILDEANLPRKLTAMDLRRTAVTEMMAAGVSDGNIMQVTGHKNFASMQPYRVNTFKGASKALAARQGLDDEHS